MSEDAEWVVARSGLLMVGNELRERSRFLLSDKNRGFVDEVVRAVSTHCRRTLDAGVRLFRGRLWDAGQTAPFEVSELHAPPAAVAKAGRVNSHGIPVLYSAEDEGTAIYETRPWVNARVTVAEFKVARVLQVADLAAGNGTGLDRALIDAARIEGASAAFARPQHRDDPSGYFATQYLAECLRRNERFDGIRFPSAVRPEGRNVVLFDPNDAGQGRIVDTYVVTAVDSTWESIYDNRGTSSVQPT